MADGKVFTDETKDLLVRFGDKCIKLGIIGELVDGPMIRGTINLIDHFGDKVIPDEYDTEINKIVTLAVSGDKDGAIQVLSEATNRVINLPVLDEESELKVFINGYAFLLSLIENLIKKEEE